MNVFVAGYRTDARCPAALQQTRWPDGFACAEWVRASTALHCSLVADGRRDRQCVTAGQEQPRVLEPRVVPPSCR
jgi:hypothetical protein